MTEEARSSLPLEVVRLRSVDSTNSYLSTLLKEGAMPGTAVIAGEQTGGRGQLGRPWYSPPGSFYLSIALECRNPRCLVFGLPWAIARTLAHACRVEAGCRWPNDVMAGPRKIGGVLIEGTANKDVWIAGCGVNINVPEFSGELSDIATSALIESGNEWPLDGELGFESVFFMHLNYLMIEISRYQLLGALTLWRGWDTTPGSLVRVRQGEAEKTVEAVGVDDVGHLVTKSGEEFEVIIGASTLEWVRTGPASEP